LISYREVEKLVNFCLYAKRRNGCPPIAEIWIGRSAVGNACPSGVRNVNPALVFGAALFSSKTLVSGAALFPSKKLVSGAALF